MPPARPTAPATPSWRRRTAIPARSSAPRRAAARRRHGAETPSAYALRMSGEFQEDARPLGELTALYVTAEYAPAEPSSGEAAEARKLARTARSRLAKRLGWRRRVGAVLSPRSLVPPPQRERVGSR